MNLGGRIQVFESNSERNITNCTLKVDKVDEKDYTYYECQIVSSSWSSNKSRLAWITNANGSSLGKSLFMGKE